MKDKIVVVYICFVIALWVLIMMFTFGHATNNKYCDYGCKFTTTMLLPVSWALYWSWELQRED